MRDKFPVVLLILLLVSGLLVYQRSQAAQRSPFPLGLAAAGMRYQELADAEARGEKLNLTCRPIASGYRLCDADTDGPPGHMLVAVNDKGRIAVLQMRFDDTTYKMRDLTSTMTNAWDEVGPRTTTSAEGTGDIMRWSSPDKRWSVEMVMRESVPTPAWVIMRDDGGIAATADRSLAALMLLAHDGLVDDDAIDAVEKSHPGSVLRAVDSLTSSGRALAELAAKLPLCGAEFSATAVEGDAREALGEPAAAIAEQAIPLALPGRKLAFGDQVYLLDGRGEAEPVTLTNLSGDESGTRYVFALNFQGRIDAVVERARSLSVKGQCRAPAAIIVAVIDSATDAVISATQAPLEGEALASRVTSAVFTTSTNRSDAVAVDYSAYYGSVDFSGEISWRASMPLDSMKIRSRFPTAFAKLDTASHSVAGEFDYAAPEATRPAESENPLDPGPLAGRRVRVDVRRDGRRRSETIVMPSPVNALPGGWTILSLF